jgi:hypothetical protein
MEVAMGFLDKLKTQATDVASTVVEKTQETARVGQLQVQLRTLRNEERDLLADFGREAYRLHEQGTLDAGSPELTDTAAKIADVRARLSEKEAEVAEARGQRPGDADTVEAEAEEIVDASATGAGTETTGETAAGTTGETTTGTTGETTTGTTGQTTGKSRGSRSKSDS